MVLPILISVSLTPGPYGPAAKASPLARMRLAIDKPVAGWPDPDGDGLLPSLHEHYTRFITTAKQSAPNRRIGTFGLTVGAACAFSLGIAV